MRAQSWQWEEGVDPVGLKTGFSSALTCSAWWLVFLWTKTKKCPPCTPNREMQQDEGNGRNFMYSIPPQLWCLWQNSVSLGVHAQCWLRHRWLCAGAKLLEWEVQPRKCGLWRIINPFKLGFGVEHWSPALVLGEAKGELCLLTLALANGGTVVLCV